MTIWDDYIHQVERDLAERQRSLEPLKSGGMRISERTSADQWVDITQREIDRREKTITTYQNLLVRLRAECEASHEHTG